jgi:hypothetical protein
MGKKVLVLIEGDKKYPTYEGRFLGFINHREFHGICEDKSLAGKIETCASIDICEAATMPTVEDMRFVIALSKIDKEPVYKKLFISEPLSMLKWYRLSENSINLTTKDDKVSIDIIEKE